MIAVTGMTAPFHARPMAVHEVVPFAREPGAVGLGWDKREKEIWRAGKGNKDVKRVHSYSSDCDSQEEQGGNGAGRIN